MGVRTSIAGPVMRNVVVCARGAYQLLMFAKGISLRHFPHHASLLISVLGLLFVGLTVALVLAVSHFTYKWIETPGRKEFKELAAKWFKRKPAGVAT